VVLCFTFVSSTLAFARQLQEFWGPHFWEYSYAFILCVVIFMPELKAMMAGKESNRRLPLLGGGGFCFFPTYIKENHAEKKSKS